MLIPEESFIEAKESEFCAIHAVARVEFDQKLLILKVNQSLTRTLH